jgi:ribonuclease R
MGKTENKSVRLKKKEIADMLLNLFEEHPEDGYDLKHVFAALRLTTHPSKMVCRDVLDDMEDYDYIYQTDDKKYHLRAQQGQVLEGTFTRKSNGKNTFSPADGGDPIFVAERNSMHAMNGDTVRVTLFARRKNHIKEAEVIEIIKHAQDTFVGKLSVEKNYAFLVTESRTLANDIFIPKDKLKGGKTGDKAIVKIIDWPEDAKNPIGAVVDILGEAGENTAEMHGILAEYGLPYVYPKNVEDAADKLPDKISAAEIAAREDFRNVTTFTIDPHDAKDFDDALSIRSIGKDLWEVGVHIADVSHYVTEGSIIDKEAYKRATSVYLVDRTVPMLPERLCNYICSLRPDEEKLTYSVIFEMNAKAEVQRWHIAHTVIRSNRRFAYEEVQAILEQNNEASEADLKAPSSPDEPKIALAPPSPDGKPVGEYAEELITLNRMAKELRKKRFAGGSIDFDRCEVRFNVDEKGRPISVYFKVAKDANKLVEEFMLLANRTVAESIGKVPKGKTPKTLPYRVHDLPDPTKLDSLSKFIVKFGYKFRTGGNRSEVTRNLNKLLADVKGKKEQNLIETVSLRAMMKARYSTINIGHYGLAFDYYTHFTSPIRRYPDLMVHRLLTRYADGGRSVNKEKYEEYCEHCSDMEQTAANAERDSIKYKQVEFMGERLGQVFDGTISGVTEFGIYVEVNENKCEGMVPMRDLDDDYYEFDEKNYCLLGRRNHHRYSLGDAVKIRVARANLERRQLDFALIREGDDRPKKVMELPPRKSKQGNKGSKGNKGGKERRGRRR